MDDVAQHVDENETAVMIKMNAILVEVAFLEMQMNGDEFLWFHAVSKAAVDDVNRVVEVDVGAARDECAGKDAWHMLEL